MRPLVLALLLAVASGPAWSQPASEHGARPAASVPAQAQAQPQAQREPKRMPADVTTHQSVALPGRTLAFAATAGSITIADAQDTPQAAIGFTAYVLDGADKTTRPVTFVVNGGPGASSAWLQLGMAGPWRLPLDGAHGAPSAPPVLIPNAETWLDFTDLVFIDPPGSGYARFLVSGEDVRKRFWSVDGDIDAISEAIRRWLDEAGRRAAPKYILGESYGGFRGPRLVQTLARSQGVGIVGLVLVSPALDSGGGSDAFDPLSRAVLLPTIVAAERAKNGPVTRTMLADAEAYAGGDYLVSLLRGEADPAEVEARAKRVAELTGLDPALVAKRHGWLLRNEMRRALNEGTGRVSGLYDATVTAADPYPIAVDASAPDASLGMLEAPLTAAVVDLTRERLGWKPDGTYQVLNQNVARAWDFGRDHGFGSGHPESLRALRWDLAADPNLHVIVAHGLYDMVTPYFLTQLQLRQVIAGADRVGLLTYPGGHMFYLRDAGRIGLRAEVKAMFGP
jgi:carboxypeptidase C (cathepsin A)